MLLAWSCPLLPGLGLRHRFPDASQLIVFRLDLHLFGRIPLSQQEFLFLLDLCLCHQFRGPSEHAVLVLYPVRCAKQISIQFLAEDEAPS